MLDFLFGRGRWVPWYLFMWFWLLPAAAVFHYFSDFVPGAGPQGGEAIFALMMVIWLGLLVAFVVNAVLLGHAAPHGWAFRWLLMPVLGFVAWGMMLLLVLLGADAASGIGGAAHERQIANAAMILVYVAAILANCWMLWWFRRA